MAIIGNIIGILYPIFRQTQLMKEEWGTLPKCRCMTCRSSKRNSTCRDLRTAIRGSISDETLQALPRIPRKNQCPGDVVRRPALRSLLPFSSWVVESTARQLKGTTPRSAGHLTTLPWTATTTRIACFGRASVSFGNTFIGPGKKLGPGTTAQRGWASPAKVSVGSTVTQDFND